MTLLSLMLDLCFVVFAIVFLVSVYYEDKRVHHHDYISIYSSDDIVDSAGIM